MAHIGLPAVRELPDSVMGPCCRGSAGADGGEGVGVIGIWMNVRSNSCWSSTNLSTSP